MVIFTIDQGASSHQISEAVLTTCSTLITVIEEDNGSRFVQFSHFSVKQFLTSDRLRTPDAGDIRPYYASLGDAHTTLARACLTALLQLDENEALVSYAAQYWVDHAKFRGVELRIKDEIKGLFDPSEPFKFLARWTSIHDVDRGWAATSVLRGRQWWIVVDSSGPRETPLYYAALCGFSELAEHLIVTHEENAHAECGTHGTPLHAASAEGHLDTVRVLLDHGAEANTPDKRKRTPLYAAYSGGHLQVMELLLERGADMAMPTNGSDSLLHVASSRGQAKVVRLLLRHYPDVHAKGTSNWTALHWASANGHRSVVNCQKLLLDNTADVDASSTSRNTPLRLAAGNGHLEVVRLLLTHGANVHTRGKDRRTPLEVAESSGHVEVAELLSQHAGGTNLRAVGQA